MALALGFPLPSSSNRPWNILRRGLLERDFWHRPKRPLMDGAPHDYNPPRHVASFSFLMLLSLVAYGSGGLIFFASRSRADSVRSGVLPNTHLRWKTLSDAH